MSFDVERVSYELIAALLPLLPCIQRRDRALAVQLTRAASSIALNVSEANYSDPGNRRARFFTAAGSANEPEWTESSLLDGVHGGLRPERSEGAPKAQ